MTGLMFPDAPTCHAEQVSGPFGHHAQFMVWRAPDLTREPYGEPFRSCGYCGSIHPGDLIEWLANGATLHGSDWKYGWPHKFYVEGIPNPQAGKVVECGSRSWSDVICSRCGHVHDSYDRPKACVQCGHAYDIDWRYGSQHREPIRQLAPPLSHAKFYNTHLNDLTDEATFNHVAAVIFEKSSIQFIRDESGLKYRAPQRGFQA